MKFLNKFSVTLQPSTTQLAYMNAKPQQLNVEWFTFNDGSICVKIPQIPMLKSENAWADTFQTVHIDAFIESMNDLMVVAQIKDIMERAFKNKTFILKILSTPYTRYDRPMLPGGIDGFGSLTFARFVNALEFDHVTLLDAHSDVIVDQTNNCHSIHMFSIHKKYFDLAESGEACIIAPDKGAAKKLMHRNGLTFDKIRNVETGRIESMKLESRSTSKCYEKNQYIVVDDICEGGRTFLQVAESFENNLDVIDPTNKREKFTLVVTHGIFSHNAIEKLLAKYTNIHAHVMKKSTYEELNELQMQRVTVDYLVDTDN